MKSTSIKIVVENAAKIEAHLARANGRARAHTFATSAEIATLAANAERSILRMLPKKSAEGAEYSARSGGSLPASYKYPRITTAVRLLRRRAGWYMVSACASNAWRSAGKAILTLTAEQDEAAVERFRSYAIAVNC